MVVNLQHMVLPVDQRGVVTNKLDHTHLRDPTKTRKAGGQSTVEKVHVTAFCSHTCTHMFYNDTGTWQFLGKQVKLHYTCTVFSGVCVY